VRKHVDLVNFSNTAPFLDVLNTLMNPENPHTFADHHEWGNPINSQELFAYIRTYSPYNNIQPYTRYPNVLARIQLNDIRVPYWGRCYIVIVWINIYISMIDPLKWIAKLRAYAASLKSGPDPHTIVAYINMNAGHSK
jgi:oligopeptidase B